MKMVEKYIQEKDVLSNIQRYLHNNKNLFILLGDFHYEEFVERITSSLTISYHCEKFIGICSKEEITRLKIDVTNGGFDCIIACGGGKILDVGKALAQATRLPIVILPTSASMDGACSALSVLYYPDGTLDEYLYLDKHPDLVLVDTEIIFQAPKRLLVAGMGDALATYFETRAFQAAYGTVEKDALEISSECYKKIMKHGRNAINDMNKGIHSKAIDKVIEANIYDSCIGFENGGLSVAHAINNALTKQPKNMYMHGECVAIGLLIQLRLEQALEYDEVFLLMKDIELPLSLKELQLNKEEQATLLKDIMEEKGIDNHPLSITYESLKQVINEFI